MNLSTYHLGGGKWQPSRRADALQLCTASRMSDQIAENPISTHEMLDFRWLKEIWIGQRTGNYSQMYHYDDQAAASDRAR